MTAWSDPAIVLTNVNQNGAQIVVTEAEIEDMTEPTMVGGFVSVGGRLSGDEAGAVDALLFMGMGVIPGSVTSIAETPRPDLMSDWDWFWYRIIPIGDAFPPGVSDQKNSFSFNDQVRSARRLDEGDKIVVSYHLEPTVGLPTVVVDFAARLLLRQP